MRWHSLTSLLMLGLAACGPKGPTQEASDTLVTNGVGIGTDRYPAVVYMTSTDGSSTSSCTATFVGPKTLLTAAHCVDGSDSVTVLGNKSTNFTMHPDFDGNTYGTYGADLAVVLFSSNIAPATMAISLTAPRVGETFAVVGYGQNDWNNRTGGGVRRYGTNTVKSHAPQSKGSFIVSNGMSASGDSPDGTDIAVGKGDSGGPMIVGNKIAGIASLAVAGSTRTDSKHANVADATNIAFLRSMEARGATIQGLTQTPPNPPNPPNPPVNPPNPPNPPVNPPLPPIDPPNPPVNPPNPPNPPINPPNPPNPPPPAGEWGSCSCRMEPMGLQRQCVLRKNGTYVDHLDVNDDRAACATACNPRTGHFARHRPGC